MGSYFMNKLLMRQEGVDDLTLMTTVGIDAIVHQLKQRLEKNKIYTNVQNVLVSVNPYKVLPIYGNAQVRKYQTMSADHSPHIYGLSERAYRAMIESGPQAVIISGESGAGKTEAAKLILHYVSSVSGSSQQAAQMKNIILLSNPLLENFGNAKTVRNNNSSRFGKYLELMFGRSNEPVGGTTRVFLLEKTRVTSCGKNERTFHIFYSLLAGGWPELLTQCQLGRAEDYFYTARGGSSYVDGINDQEQFQEVLNAMNAIGMGMEEQWYLFACLGGILHLGNAQLVGKDAPAQMQRGTEYSLQMAAYLFGVEPEALLKSLSHKVVTMGGRRASVVAIPQNGDQATQIRDALAKEMYSRIFELIIYRLNTAMYTRDAQHGKTIGILDIYGFEIFKHNGFEQLCINYVNEQLQQIFVNLTIRGEQEVYQREGLKWRQIDYFDNKTVVELIAGANPVGIFRLLDDTCRSLHAVDSQTADQKYIEKLSMSAIASHPHLRVLSSTSAYSAGFTIKHYAGDVTYSVEEMAFKNMDNLFHSLVNCMKESNNPFVRALWGNDDLSQHRQPTTSSMKIRASCNDLVQSLMRTQVNYVRCLKSNEEKRPMHADTKRMTHQVRYLGLLESVKVAKAGYSYRAPFDTFVQRFYMLKPNMNQGGMDGCREVINHVCKKYNDFTASEFVFGRSQIFVNSPETIFLLEEYREMQMDPKGYAEKVKEHERMEALANKQEKKAPTKGGCCTVS